LAKKKFHGEEQNQHKWNFEDTRQGTRLRSEVNSISKEAIEETMGSKDLGLYQSPNKKNESSSHSLLLSTQGISVTQKSQATLQDHCQFSDCQSCSPLQMEILKRLFDMQNGATEDVLYLLTISVSTFRPGWSQSPFNLNSLTVV